LFPGRDGFARTHLLGHFCADERNLNLLSLGAIKQLLPSTGKSRIGCLKTLGLPSNIDRIGAERESAVAASA